MSSLRILMYSQGCAGLGPTSRVLKVASHLSKNFMGCSFLLITDLPIIGRLKLPENLDYVHLPGVQQQQHQQYRARDLNIEFKQTLKIRRKIIQGTAKTFKPDVILVDSDPLILAGEMKRVLASAKRELPETRIVWALPDTMGETQVVSKEWTDANVQEFLALHCDEVWIYGNRDIFDQAQYRLSAELLRKIVYTGYLRSPSHASDRVLKDVSLVSQETPVVVVTAGSGTSGYAMIDNYLSAIENAAGRTDFHSIIFSGPMMPSYEKGLLKERAERLPNVIFHRFSRHFLDYLKAAKLVICSGGHNTLSEIFSYQKNAIIVPDLDPTDGHIHRSRIFDKLGFIRLLLPENLSPENLGNMIKTELSNLQAGLRRNLNGVPFDGLETVIERIKLTNSALAKDKQEVVPI